ncbi:MAG: hypothetical protein ACXWSC_10770, partial [Bdellovibrionota bacterium]
MKGMMGNRIAKAGARRLSLLACVFGFTALSTAAQAEGGAGSGKCSQSKITPTKIKCDEQVQQNLKECELAKNNHEDTRAEAEGARQKICNEMETLKKNAESCAQAKDSEACMSQTTQQGRDELAAAVDLLQKKLDEQKKYQEELLVNDVSEAYEKGKSDSSFLSSVHKLTAGQKPVLDTDMGHIM